MEMVSVSFVFVVSASVYGIPAVAGILVVVVGILAVVAAINVEVYIVVDIHSEVVAIEADEFEFVAGLA